MESDNMNDIKNFKKVVPTNHLLEKYTSPLGEVPSFLESEDGQDWYLCQSSFADDTVKIEYDSNGVIRAVVDKPVPARGHTYAVSMLFPDGHSVAEVAIDEYPEGCCLDGTWKYDGTKVYQDFEIVNQKILDENTGKRDSLMRKASVAVITIQASAAVDNPRTGDSDNLLLLQQYLDALRDVDLTAPSWPSVPPILV